ncbi:PREDICTED: ribosomal RNA small subunit methyltransferase G-like [Prunus mume]|uniref:Ribosomal RNA small subunit methyltransferase G-like n=1 Tax=Prunus mume TaxID=102107 RepID=A0ABM0PHQ8_PRUMU|nr:PREDICTED: ribosomal RNA small subunit methyltransferase G-like [Prunus mume]
MFVSRCVVTFSLGTFIKHLPISKRTTFCPYRIRPKTITTTRILCSSYFETLDSHQKEQIHLYVDTLLEWNQRMNLTAVKEVNEVMERHIEDSLAIIPPIRNSYLSHCSPSSSNNLSLVDVGSGAGLPGLVLAIACPGWEVTLMESMNKRCLFLEHVVSHIGLSNVQIVRGRAENLGQALCFREKFDVAVARAVAEMRVLAEYCLPLVCVGGLFVAAKGHDPEVEVRNAEKAIQILGASVLQLCPVESHSPYGQRTAIVCLKTSPTPRKYPRDPGTPEKTPL